MRWRKHMKLLKKGFVAALVFMMAAHFFPKPLGANDLMLAVNTPITEHPIESTASPDEVPATIEGKKQNWLLWSLVGVALVGGIAAVAGSGGGGGGGDDGGDSPGTGTIPVQW